MKQKTFSISFKDLPLKHVKPTFLEGESPTLTGCVNNNQKQPRFCFYEFLYLIVFMAFPVSIVKHKELTRLFYKQPPEVFCKKRWLQKFRKIHSKTPVPDSGTGVFQ